MGNNNEHQELDLLTLIRKTFDFSYRILRKIAGFLGHLLQLTFKYKYVFLGVFAVTLVYAYYTCSKGSKTYRAGLILELNDGDANFYSGEIVSLNRYPAVLQLSNETAGKFMNVGISFSINSNDSTLLRAELSIGLTDPQVFPEIKDALIDYFDRNEYLKSLNTARVASLEMINNILERDIAEIDSLSKIEYFQKKTQEAILSDRLILKPGIQLFYSDKLTLLEQKDQVTKELTVKSGIVTILSEFQPAENPAPSFRAVAVKYEIAAFILFLLFALLWNNRKCILNYLRGDGDKDGE